MKFFSIYPIIFGYCKYKPFFVEEHVPTSHIFKTMHDPKYDFDLKIKYLYLYSLKYQKLMTKILPK